METRLHILSRYYSVTGARGIAELPALANAEDFDLVLLCHSLPEKECQAIASFLRERWPHAKLLRIYRRDAAPQPCEADARVGALDGPLALLRAVEDLLHPGQATA